eukprot:4776617-Pyramimonas_sp.AAC.1
MKARTSCNLQPTLGWRYLTTTLPRAGSTDMTVPGPTEPDTSCAWRPVDLHLVVHVEAALPGLGGARPGGTADARCRCGFDHALQDRISDAPLQSAGLHFPTSR